MLSKKASIICAVYLVCASAINAVDVPSPVGDWVCRVADGSNRGEITTTISFGRLAVNAESTFVEMAVPPLIAFPKEGLYPMASVCWSPNGRLCMIGAIERKRFSVQIVDVSGVKAKTTGIAVDELLDAELESLKLRESLDGRWLRSAHWFNENDLRLLVEDGLFNENIPRARYEISIKKTKGEWSASIVKKDLKRMSNK